MAKRAIGVKSIKMGAIAGDGDMGPSLVALGNTVKDTVVITNDQGQTQDFFIEETDDPVESIVTEKGKFKANWSTYDISAQKLSDLFGGEYTAPAGGDGAMWEAPDTTPIIEKSFEFETPSGIKIQIPRGKVQASLEWNLKKTALAQVNIEVSALAPNKVGVKALKVIEPA